MICGFGLLLRFWFFFVQGFWFLDFLIWLIIKKLKKLSLNSLLFIIFIDFGSFGISQCIWVRLISIGRVLHCMRCNIVSFKQIIGVSWILLSIFMTIVLLAGPIIKFGKGRIRKGSCLMFLILQVIIYLNLHLLFKLLFT